MSSGLHRLDVNGRNAAYRVLHDDIEHALAVRHALLRHAAEVDCADHRSVLRIDDGCVFRRVTEDVDPLVEVIEEDAIRPCGAHVNALDQR